MKNLLSIILIALLALPTAVMAEKTIKVNGKSSIRIRDIDNITLREAKRQCIDNAKAEIIKEYFGELVSLEVIDQTTEMNGMTTSSYLRADAMSHVKGKWLNDTKEPVVNVTYDDGDLIFTAEVWGVIREITRAQTELKWNLLKEGSEDGKKDETVTAGAGVQKCYYAKQVGSQVFYDSGERFYINFHAPTDGYVAVYLNQADNTTACLLPYRSNTTGQMPVKSGKDYVFFDKRIDRSADIYKLETNRELEDNQLIIIFSKNPFTKCNDITTDPRHPNMIEYVEFNNWLTKIQREDDDLVVEKKWVKIKKKK